MSKELKPTDGFTMAGERRSGGVEVFFMSTGGSDGGADFPRDTNVSIYLPDGPVDRDPRWIQQSVLHCLKRLRA